MVKGWQTEGAGHAARVRHPNCTRGHQHVDDTPHRNEISKMKNVMLIQCHLVAVNYKKISTSFDEL